MTFPYDDLAETVTDLLTEFGQAITLSRYSATFNSVTGKDSAASTASLTTVGVWQSIRAELIDGSRIQAGDKLLIIDASVTPAMGDKVDGWQIVDITTINPAGTALAYRLQVRK